MTAETEAPTTARTHILPLLSQLDHILADEERLDAGGDVRAFFRGIGRAIERAEEPADLMQPFMQLSTTAFRGFVLGPESTLVVDQVLEAAQTISYTLAADETTRH